MGFTRKEKVIEMGGIIEGGATGSTDMPSVTDTGVFIPMLATTALKPAAVRGGLFFDTTLNKFYKCQDGTNWVTIETA